MKTVKETSYGIIPLLYKEEELFVFIVKHSNSSFWGFPKGHPDDHEVSPLETATRELKEETNLDVLEVYDMNPFTEEYEFIRGNEKVLKTVVLFAAVVSSEYKIDDKEILDAKWVSLKNLATNLTYPEAKNIANKLNEYF